MRADELNFLNVNHRHSGVYVCTADNGFGEPVCSLFANFTHCSLVVQKVISL